MTGGLLKFVDRAPFVAAFSFLAAGCAGVGSGTVPTALEWRDAPDALLLRYERVMLLEETSETSANVSIGDLNGDGHPDIVLAKGRHWPLTSRVLLNNGRGRFPMARDLDNNAARSYSAKLADIDGDRDLDVVVGNDAPDRKLVYLNDGLGDFRIGSEFGNRKWPTRNVEVGDLNGDAWPDIVVANRSADGDDANYVCLNQGRGVFEGNCIAFSREPATTITVADFNRDGTLDLAVPHRDGGQSHIYVNDGSARFQRWQVFGPVDAHFRMALAADMNGDGIADLVALDEMKGVYVFFQGEGGVFAAGLRLGDDDAAPYALALRDLNNDGTIDVVVGRAEAPSTVYLNDGSGRAYAAVQFGDGKGTVYGIAVGDLDRDGSLDIAAARSDAPNTVYFGGPQ